MLKRGDVAALSAALIHQTKAIGNDVQVLTRGPVSRAHARTPVAGEDCCSLTVYSPPFEDYTCYCSKTGRAEPSCAKGPADL